MSTETVLSAALLKLGYKKQLPWTYKLAAGSLAVEHFLYFVFRPEKKLIAAHFGFRNGSAEQFSIMTFARFAANDFPAQNMLAQSSCSMRFSFGRFYSMEYAGYWPLKGDGNWVDLIISDLTAQLLPFTRQLSNCEQMFGVLSGDAEPCPWIATNAAIRIAQIMFLGGRLGKTPDQLRGLIASKLNSIQSALDSESSDISADEFVSLVFQESNMN